MNKTKLTSNNVFSNTNAYIVGSIDSIYGLSASSHPVLHASKAQAREECARLAKLNPNKTFVILSIVGGELIHYNPTQKSF